jgi:hypothetical protein
VLQGDVLAMLQRTPGVDACDHLFASTAVNARGLEHTFALSRLSSSPTCLSTG